MNATVGILTCLWAWNDFLLPLVILTSPDAHTVAFASYLMAMAPLLIVYIFAQRWVISGVMRGSVT